MKISENIEKMTLPGRKSLYRYYDSEGNFFRDAILLENENPDLCDHIISPVHPEKRTSLTGLRRELLHHKVYENKAITYPLPDPQQCSEYLFSRAAHLPAEHKRFIMPHIYKVGCSIELLKLCDELQKDISNNFAGG